MVLLGLFHYLIFSRAFLFSCARCGCCLEYSQLGRVDDAHRMSPSHSQALEQRLQWGN